MLAVSNHLAGRLDGRSGILASHLNFGDRRSVWDFRSPGRSQVNFEEIVRTLNHIGYRGTLSEEWEDSRMDHEHRVIEALDFVRQLDFEPQHQAFGLALERE